MKKQTKNNSMTRLPDGSGFFVGSMPLPSDHWSTVGPNKHNEPPRSFRMGYDDSPRCNWTRKDWQKALTTAARFAYRAATMNGKSTDLDPDALIQNLVVGFLGEHTHNGLPNGRLAG